MFVVRDEVEKAEREEIHAVSLVPGLAWLSLILLTARNSA